MTIKEKPCFWCGTKLVTARNKGKVFCGSVCTQEAHKHKSKVAPAVSHRAWRSVVAEEVLANKPHPNIKHKSNLILSLIKTKLSELEELRAIKNQSINY